MKIPNDSQVFPTSLQLKMNVFDDESIDAANSFSSEDVVFQKSEEDIDIFELDDVENSEDVNYDAIDIVTLLDDLAQSSEECECDDCACSSPCVESCESYDDASFSIDPVSSFDDMDRIIRSGL